MECLARCASLFEQADDAVSRSVGQRVHQPKSGQHLTTIYQWAASNPIAEVRQQRPRAAFGQALADIPHDRLNTEPVHEGEHTGWRPAVPVGVMIGAVRRPSRVSIVMLKWDTACSAMVTDRHSRAALCVGGQYCGGNPMMYVSRSQPRLTQVSERQG